MKSTNYYYVWDTYEGANFWIIGKATSDNIPSESYDCLLRGTAIFINSGGQFKNNEIWCYKDKTREYRDATYEEIDWLNACIAEGKYLDKDHPLVLKYQKYEIY